jgi:hypothetical protein
MTKTNTPQIKEVNCETGEEIIRNANAEEIAQIELDAANYAAQKTEADAKAIAKAALLDKLGISSDEAKLLLG